MAVRERLGSEEQARFDFQYLRVNAAAKELAERHGELSLIPISQPDAIPKKIWRKKKTNFPTSSPISIYSTSYTVQREGRKRAQEDEQGG
jgi:hypothetical protein